MLTRTGSQSSWASRSNCIRKPWLATRTLCALPRINQSTRCRPRRWPALALPISALFFFFFTRFLHLVVDGFGFRVGSIGMWRTDAICWYSCICNGLLLSALLEFLFCKNSQESGVVIFCFSWARSPPKQQLDTRLVLCGLSPSTWRSSVAFSSFSLTFTPT